MQLCRGRALGIAVAVAHGVFSGSLNILLKFLISRYHFVFLTLLQCLTSSTAALSLEVLRRRGTLELPPFGFSLARLFAGVTVLSTLQSSLTLWSLRGLSLPMYVVFKRCLPLVTLLIGALVLKNGVPSVGVLVAVLITTVGAALAGERDGAPAGDRSRFALGSPAPSPLAGPLQSIPPGPSGMSQGHPPPMPLLPPPLRPNSSGPLSHPSPMAPTFPELQLFHFTTLVSHQHPPSHTHTPQGLLESSATFLITQEGPFLLT